MKKLLSLIIAIILTISLLPAAVFAVEAPGIESISISGISRLFLTVNYTDGTSKTSEVTDFTESEEQPENNRDLFEGDFVTNIGTFHGLIRFDVSESGIQRFADGVQLEIAGVLSNKLDKNLFLLLKKIKEELVPAVLTKIVEGRIEGGQSSSFNDDVLADLSCGLVGKYAWIAEGEDENGKYRIFSADVVTEAVETVTDARDFWVAGCPGYDKETGTVKIYDPVFSDIKGNVKVQRYPDSEGVNVVFTSLEEPQFYSGYYSYFTHVYIGVRSDGRIYDIWPYVLNWIGDVDGDYNVDIKDLLLLRSALAGIEDLTEKQFDRADVNGDGIVNMKDVLALRRIVAGAA